MQILLKDSTPGTAVPARSSLLGLKYQSVPVPLGQDGQADNRKML